MMKIYTLLALLLPLGVAAQNSEFTNASDSILRVHFQKNTQKNHSVPNKSSTPIQPNFSRQAYTMKMDSSVDRTWDTTLQQMVVLNKTEYLYNNKNKYPIETIESGISPITGALTKTNKHELDFDANDVVTLNASYSWNDTLSIWKGLEKRTYTYDENYNPLMMKSYQFTGNQWINTQKWEGTYSSTNDRLTQTYSELNIVSNTFEPVSLYEWAYVSPGLLSSFIEKQWNPNTNAWVPQKSTQYTYNSNGDEINNLSMIWDIGQSAFINQYQLESFFNANFKDSIALYSRWNTNNQTWDSAGLTTTTYNSTSDSILTIHLTRNINTTIWTNQSKRITVFNANQKPLVLQDYSWKNNAWTGRYYLKFAYNSWGNQILLQGFEWTQNNNWIPDHKEETTFNVDGNTLSRANYYWDQSSSIWIGNHKQESIFDTDGYQTQSIYFYWSNSNWVYRTKSENLYDMDRNRIGYNGFKWDLNTNTWVNWQKSKFSLDLTILYVELQLPYTMFPISHPKLDKYASEKWNTSQSSWENHYREDYYYSNSKPNSVTEITNTEISLYPNPFNNSITITAQENNGILLLELFDIQGRKVQSTPFENTTELETSHLSSGMYIYKISGENNTISGKLIKQ